MSLTRFKMPRLGDKLEVEVAEKPKKVAKDPKSKKVEKKSNKPKNKK